MNDYNLEVAPIKWYYKLLFLFIRGEWFGEADDVCRVYVKRYKNIIYVVDQKYWPDPSVKETK